MKLSIDLEEETIIKNYITTKILKKNKYLKLEIKYYFMIKLKYNNYLENQNQNGWDHFTYMKYYQMELTELKILKELLRRC